MADSAGGSVTGNNKVMEEVHLSQISRRTRSGLYVTRALNSRSRVVEMEAYQRPRLNSYDRQAV